MHHQSVKDKAFGFCGSFWGSSKCCALRCSSMWLRDGYVYCFAGVSLAAFQSVGSWVKGWCFWLISVSLAHRRVVVWPRRFLAGKKKCWEVLSRGFPHVGKRSPDKWRAPTEKLKWQPTRGHSWSRACPRYHMPFLRGEVICHQNEKWRNIGLHTMQLRVWPMANSEMKDEMKYRL